MRTALQAVLRSVKKNRWYFRFLEMSTRRHTCSLRSYGFATEGFYRLRECERPRCSRRHVVRQSSRVWSLTPCNLDSRGKIAVEQGLATWRRSLHEVKCWRCNRQVRRSIWSDPKRLRMVSRALKQQKQLHMSASWNFLAPRRLRIRRRSCLEFRLPRSFRWRVVVNGYRCLMTAALSSS